MPAVSIFSEAFTTISFPAVITALFVLILPEPAFTRISFPAVKSVSSATVISPVPFLNVRLFSTASILPTIFISPVILLISIFPIFLFLSNLTASPLIPILFTRISPELFAKLIELNLFASPVRLIPSFAWAVTMFVMIVFDNDWLILPAIAVIFRLAVSIVVISLFTDSRTMFFSAVSFVSPTTFTFPATLIESSLFISALPLALIFPRRSSPSFLPVK